MQIRFILLLWLGLPIFGNAQNLLLKKNGDNIPFKKIFPMDDHIIVLNEKKQQIKITQDDIIGYYDSDIQEIFFLIPVTFTGLNKNDLMKKNRTSSMEFMKRILTGEIMVFETRTNISGIPETNMMGNTVPQYYLKKNNEYNHVTFSGLLSDNSTDLAVLKSVLDDLEFVSKIEGKGFNFSQKKVSEILREYNLKYYSPIGIDDYHKTGTICFYTRMRPEIRKDIIVQINDSIDYKLPMEAKPLPVRLPLNKPSKVCLRSPEGVFCEIVMPFFQGALYYEINRKVVDESFEIEKTSLAEFKNYMRSN